MKTKINSLYLCSFASPDLKRSKQRFIEQAKKISIYKKIQVFGIDDLSKSVLIDSESQRGVLTEPKVIVQALIELDLSSSLRHLVNIARADFDTQYAPH